MKCPSCENNLSDYPGSQEQSLHCIPCKMIYNAEYIEQTMRKVKGIDVPETIGEAKTMTYEQLQDACEVFNNHGVSVEYIQEIKEAWDKNFWDGYHACLDMVLGIFDSVDQARLPSIESLRDEIVETYDLYKKDG